MRCVHRMLPRDWAGRHTYNKQYLAYFKSAKEYEHNGNGWYAQGMNAKFNGILHFIRKQNQKQMIQNKTATVANILRKAVMPFSRQQSESNQMKWNERMREILARKEKPTIHCLQSEMQRRKSLNKWMLLAILCEFNENELYCNEELKWRNMDLISLGLFEYVRVSVGERETERQQERWINIWKLHFHFGKLEIWNSKYLCKWHSERGGWEKNSISFNAASKRTDDQPTKREREGDTEFCFKPMHSTEWTPWKFDFHFAACRNAIQKYENIGASLFKIHCYYFII